MTVTREELHDLIDRLPADELERVARTLQTGSSAPQVSPPWPQSLGMVKAADPKASERVDEHLAKGFGR
ncbi:hypothetical protein [Nesterenkonia ebinurensis]|uniref:hypothetical protein n=1 Tax=Nesterenkonia ebinurensis TaxID=2608252 RepID=UPI00123E002F|nr:hypothetical protein [Nesterenkonia ebinurensis]